MSLTTSITTSSIDIITYYQQTMRLYQISKTNHSKHIRWSCCPSTLCSLYEKRRSVVMGSHKVQHKQPTSYVASNFKIEAPFISYFCSSCFIPYRMLIYINYKFKSTALFSTMLNTTTYMTLLFVILGFTLPSLILHIRPFAFTSGSKLYEQYDHSLQ